MGCRGGHLLRRNLQRIGRLNLISPQQVLEKENELKGQIKSNDSHIIALAMVADVKVLVSEDKTLHKDFKNPGWSAAAYTRQKAFTPAA